MISTDHWLFANKCEWVWLDGGCIKFKITKKLDLLNLLWSRSSKQQTVREIITDGQPSLKMQTLDGGFNE